MGLLNQRFMKISVYDSRDSMGLAAALAAGEILKKLLQEHKEVNVVFAAAPSQNEFLDALSKIQDIEWHRINAFHLDEYIGLPSDAVQRFSRYLDERIFKRVPFKTVNYVIPVGMENEDPEKLAARYEQLLKEHPLHLACIGIGENGHIAFNEPSVADFDDPYLVKVVELEEKSRQQQVNDGCFERLDDVPTHALTLTIPAIMNAQYIVCVVPGERKKEAVFKTLEGAVTPECPASVLRRHRAVHMFLDIESSSLLLKKGVNG